MRLLTLQLFLQILFLNVEIKPHNRNSFHQSTKWRPLHMSLKCGSQSRSSWLCTSSTVFHYEHTMMKWGNFAAVQAKRSTHHNGFCKIKKRGVFTQRTRTLSEGGRVLSWSYWLFNSPTMLTRTIRLWRNAHHAIASYNTRKFPFSPLIRTSCWKRGEERVSELFLSLFHRHTWRFDDLGTRVYFVLQYCAMQFVEECGEK